MTEAAASLRLAGHGDITMRHFPGGHELGSDELREMVRWWLLLTD